MIKFFGAFAAALSYIIYFANKSRKKYRLKGKNTFYRGLKLPKEELDSYELGKVINLTGYTSSSKERKIAIKFACIGNK